jgi:phosphoribosylaminoimidazole-succinocarboxamide synthase
MFRSALGFDVTIRDWIPWKGRVLTQISAFWFRMLVDIVPNRMICIEVDAFPPESCAHAETLRGRSTLRRKAKPFPAECVVWEYMSGSDWVEYKEKGEMFGVTLHKGLRE